MGCLRFERLPQKVLFHGSSSNLPEHNNWMWHVTGAADRSRFTHAAVISGAQVFGSVSASCSAAPCFWDGAGGGEGETLTLVAAKGEEGAANSCHLAKEGLSVPVSARVPRAGL